MTWRELPAPGGRPPRRVGESLGAVARMGGGPSGEVLVILVNGWSDIVGATLAAHSRPLRLAGGVLTVAVDLPAWATELRWLEADLLARIASSQGPGLVGSITVTVRPE